MRILLLNQAFYPDVVSSGQHLTDLAVSLAHVGHDVTVVAAAQKRFVLDAARRLRQKAEFERLLRQGERRVLEGYTFFIGRRAAGKPRLGMLVSRKHAAAAVDRNRIKRCIREAFRLEQERLGPLDVLVRPPYGPASRDMVSLVRRLFSRLNA